jgi:hypothetical protein
MQKDPFKKGELVRCIAARDENQITMGKTYTVVVDEGEGIFPDRPFVTIAGDTRNLCCHASRFERIPEEDQNEQGS